MSHFTHVTSHDHVLCTGTLKLFSDERIGNARVLVHAGVERKRLDACFLRTQKPFCLRLRRDDDHDLGIERSFIDRIDERLEIGATSANENAYLERLGSSGLQIFTHGFSFIE